MTTEEYCKKAKKIIGNKTPLKSDCGVLCNRACCYGDKETGMYLFPGEKTDLTVTEKCGRRIAVCNSSCYRVSRPLSCMFFPFFPSINEKGKILVVPDSRAYGICPMIQNYDMIKFDKSFIKAIKRAGKILAANDEIKQTMMDISEEIEDAKALINNLTKNQ